MARLYLFAEGQTEQTFADNLIKQELARHQVYLQNPVLIAHAKKKGRIITQFPGYGKAKSTFGPQLAERIGLSKIRSKCAHFNRWLSRLETLNAECVNS